MKTIYLLTNKITGKGYVGQTSKTVKERILRHFHSTGHQTTPVSKAIKKYGRDNFTYQTLMEVPELEANEVESMCMGIYNTLLPDGYNSCWYSNWPLGRKMSKLNREKAAERARNRIKSPKELTEMSERLRGNKIWLGRTHTEETKRKISKSKKGKKRPPMREETRRKIALARTGKPTKGPRYVAMKNAGLF